MEKLCVRFIEPAVMEGAEIDETMIDDEVNYLLLEETCLGFATMNLLGDLFNNGDITDSFLQGKCSIHYHKNELSEPFWKHAV